LCVCAVISVIPTIARLRAPSTVGIRALLLAPTRELAEQIHREVLRLVEGRRFKVCLLSKKISGKAIASQVRCRYHTLVGGIRLIPALC
jgi:ATP-dependent RNA helicase DDX52/ROK1